MVGKQNEIQEKITMIVLKNSEEMDPNISSIQIRRITVTNNTTHPGLYSIAAIHNMLKPSNKESCGYWTLVTMLLFLWAFSYGLLGTLNSQIATISSDSQSQTLRLSCAYFGAYLFGPLVLGRWVLTTGAFKVTLVVGLCVYGAGKSLRTLSVARCQSLNSCHMYSYVLGFSRLIIISRLLR